jgi:threonine aldolase
MIAERIAALPGIWLDLGTVQSNIVIWEMADGAPDAAAVVARAKAAGVLISGLAPRTVRAVTHRDVSGEQCRLAAEFIAGAVG